MAKRGPKNTPVQLKVLKGNPGKREIPSLEDLPVREESLPIPDGMQEEEKALWNRWIETAWWLDVHDVPKARIWVALQWEFECDPREMNSARISQLRTLGSELGFDPSSRAGLASAGRKKIDPADKYFA